MEDQHLLRAEPDDEILVAKVVQGDITAFTLLYDRYVQPIYAVAVYMLGDTTDAEEIVQAVFLRLWDKAGQFDRERGSFKAWFMAMARYRVLDELRYRNQQQRLIMTEDIDQLLATAEAPMVDIEKEVGLREDSETILRALQSLPAEQRRVIVLAYFGGLSQSSIAEYLDWPLGTVKKRIRLGLQKLRASLTPQRPIVETQQSPTAADAK